jgi:hypothetical protein
LKKPKSSSFAELKQTNHIFSMSENKKPEHNQDLKKDLTPKMGATPQGQITLSFFYSFSRFKGIP